MDLSISHYDVHCDDLEKARRFYTEVLGFDLLFATPQSAEAPLDLVWLGNSAGVVIELTKEKGDYPAEARNRSSLGHIALRTADLDAAVSWLKSQGVEFELEPADIVLPFARPLSPEQREFLPTASEQQARMRVAFFRGPSGERFEILQDAF